MNFDLDSEVLEDKATFISDNLETIKNELIVYFYLFSQDITRNQYEAYRGMIDIHEQYVSAIPAHLLLRFPQNRIEEISRQITQLLITFRELRNLTIFIRL